MAQKMEERSDRLRFLFTEDGFVFENQGEEFDEGLGRWPQAFEEDRYQALYELGFQEKPGWLDTAGVFLYLAAEQFLKLLTRQPDLELLRENARVSLDEPAWERLSQSVPFCIGAEYVDEEWIGRLFGRLNQVYAREIAAFDGSVSLYLAGKSQHLRVPERIFFHLVENDESSRPTGEGVSGRDGRSGDYPFAFLATYSTRDEKNTIRHMPLQYALTEYQADRKQLVELLSCLNKAADASPLIAEFVEKGEMFHMLRLTADEAHRILRDIPAIEEAGIVCRIPNWWRKNSARVSEAVKLGDERPPMVGLNAIISMKPELVVDGVPLTEEEIRDLLVQTEGLALIKGKWIEVDHDRLQSLLDEMESYAGEVTLLEALRMELGRKREEGKVDVGPTVTNGRWLSELLARLRKPEKIEAAEVPDTFQATLRPYQESGFTWLDYMDELGFGACLADDMGLGKTVQVLAYLEKLRTVKADAKVLLVVPASLIGNWQKESEKFAPGMPVQILHGAGAKALGPLVKDAGGFLTITTYGMVSRIPELEEVVWDSVILDEAQAIKNPSTKQTRQIKKLKANMRIAMTGTPIENDLTNLWSLFDFLNKGLLGSSAEFHDYCKQLEEYPEGYAHLKSMIAPFMLRRVKTDKSIISDLPEKLEQVDYVSLSKKQAVLYRRYVKELEQKLADLDGMQRRGLVLASLTKLKQICNHPDQYLGEKAFDGRESGKFEMLRELCGTIYEKRERVLVFTQFKEITEYLDRFLREIFHKKGFILHGGTPVAVRSQMVEEFQSERYIPYMILSVRAGGTGLTLTKASHVIHFDRWWNPAVENQATDRAYRIGQEKNVVVHKLVCKGTIEEKIDAMLTSKKELAENVIGSGGENWITEMSNEELMSILRLD